MHIVTGPFHGSQGLLLDEDVYYKLNTHHMLFHQIWKWFNLRFLHEFSISKCLLNDKVLTQLFKLQ